ncbi:MAG: T9SS type A sorting domain-containing protein, partial [bacterium]
IETGTGECGDVSCDGVGEDPVACSVVPGSLDFGTVTVGSYVDDTFTITNTGGGTLTGSVSEPCNHYAIFSGGGAYSLGAGQSVVVTVRFEPTTSGPHACSIETGTGECGDVSCTGVGEDPAACLVSPASLDFGTVTVGDHVDDTFTITNTGGGTLTGSVSEPCSHYIIVSGGGAYSLGTGQSVVVTVRFEPTASGPHACTIETGSGECGDVSCDGVGEDPAACSVSPASLDFGTVTVGSYTDDTFTITNTGGGTLTGSVSEPCDHFAIVSGGGTYSLSSGQSVVVTVRFEPTAGDTFSCLIETGDSLCGDVACTGIGEDLSAVPQVTSYALYQNSPNPFNPMTVITLDLPKDHHVRLTVYAMDGRRITTLFNEQMTAGRHEAVWTGRDESGRQVPSGVYFYRVEAGRFSETKRMTLLK